MKRIGLLFGVFLVGVILLACAPKVIPVEKPESSILIEKPEVTAKEPWEAQWETTLKIARKEQRVNIITSASGADALRIEFDKIFPKRYGLKLSWTAGRGIEMAQKIITERNTGIYSYDIYLGAAGTMVATLKPARIFQSLKTALVLPEVKDEKVWWEGRLPFLDVEEKYVLALGFYPQSPLHVNKKLVPNYKEELYSYYDLLKPKWKGGILAGDFIRIGSTFKWFWAMIEKDFGPVLGLDYMKALAKQEPLILTDSRLAAEWLIRGKYPLGLGLDIEPLMASWKREGFEVPLDLHTPKEGSYVSVGAQCVSFIDKAPNPNAAKVFFNWLLSKEGQILFSKVTIKHSSRIDIPDPKEIDPLIIARDPKLKYPNPNQEKYLIKEAEYRRTAEEIFGTLYK